MPAAPGPFDGLDEVWIWPVPHPDDPEPKDAEHLVTRIGDRVDGALVGRAEVRTTPGRILGGLRHRLVGLGPWRDADLGSLDIPTNDRKLAPSHAWLTVDGVRGRWTASGTFRLGDHDEVTRLASRGRPTTAARDVRAVGANAVDLGRRYLRYLRVLGGHQIEPTPGLRIGDPVDGELVAGGGWLVATQHRSPIETPTGGGDIETWQVRIDRDRAVGPVGLGVGLAALALVHHPLLAHQGEWMV